MTTIQDPQSEKKPENTLPSGKPPQPRKSLNPRWVWIGGILGGAIALALLGVGITRLMTSTQASSNQNSETATSLPQRVAVVALGRLEPRGEVVRVSGPNGERLKQAMVKQGDMVRTGDILAYLETYDEKRAERDLAASQLAEAEQRLQATTTYSQAQIREAKTRIQQVDRPATYEIDAQNANIRRLDAELAMASNDLRRFQNLYRNGAISQQSLDQQASRTRQLQEQLNNAKATLIQLEAAWKSNLSNAEAQLKAQQANLPLTQVQVAVDSARQSLKLAEARLERTIIRAPRTGRVLNIHTYAGEAIGNDGILDLGDTRQMYAIAEVDETNIGLVQAGQKATIISRNGSFDRPLTGTVAEIGWQIFKNDVLDDDPAAKADARVVEVKIRLDDSKPVESLTNLQVDVEIAIKP
jgi:HlyD family secretion protein